MCHDLGRVEGEGRRARAATPAATPGTARVARGRGWNLVGYDRHQKNTWAYPRHRSGWEFFFLVPSGFLGIEFFVILSWHGDQNKEKVQSGSLATQVS